MFVAHINVYQTVTIQDSQEKGSCSYAGERQRPVLFFPFLKSLSIDKKERVMMLKGRSRPASTSLDLRKGER